MVYEPRIRKLRMKKLNLLASLFAISVICLTASDALACLCEPLSPTQRTKLMKKHADAIFTGTVLSTVQINVSTWETILLVADSWKGQTSGEIKLQSSGGCRSGFVVGQRHLVYGKRNADGVLVTEVCWGTGLTKFNKADLKRLGKPSRSRNQAQSLSLSPLNLSLCI